MFYYKIIWYNFFIIFLMTGLFAFFFTTGWFGIFYLFIFNRKMVRDIFIFSPQEDFVFFFLQDGSGSHFFFTIG